MSTTSHSPSFKSKYRDSITKRSHLKTLQVNEKRGFTLVELSIVLVIIGLLIGGILAARSMVKSAEINAFIKQIQQIDIATANFQTNYKSIPGDSKLFDPTVDGNGILDGGDDAWEALPETSNFFVHLGQTGFMPNASFTATVAGGKIDYILPTINLPESKIGKKGTVITPIGPAASWYTNPNAFGLYSGRNFNHYLIVNLSTDSYIGDSAYATLLPTDALAIDTKIDDAKPLAGNVIGMNSNGVHTDKICVITEDDANTGYDITQTSEQCELSIRMFSQTGGQ